MCIIYIISPFPCSDSYRGVADSNRDNGEEDNKAFVAVGGVPLRGVLVSSQPNLCWFPPPAVTHDPPGGGGGGERFCRGCPGSVLYQTGSLGCDSFYMWRASTRRPLTLMERKVSEMIHFVI